MNALAYSPNTRISDVDAENIGIDEAADRYVKEGIAYWNALRGERRYPSHTELSLRGMSNFVAHAVIVKVLNGGEDYVYGFVGDAQARAFKNPIKGWKVSQIEEAVPHFGMLLRGAYDQTRVSGEAFAVRSRVNLGSSELTPYYQETAFLPLGEEGGPVDRILVVGVQIPRHFLALSSAEIATIGARWTGIAAEQG